LAQEVPQQQPGLHLPLVARPVHRQRDPLGLGHARPLLSRPAQRCAARAAACLSARSVSTPTRWRRKSAEACTSLEGSAASRAFPPPLSTPPPRLRPPRRPPPRRPPRRRR